MITDRPATENAFIRQAMPIVISVSASVWARYRLPLADLDDVRAEAMIGALKAYRTWDGSTSAFGSYVYRCARNSAVDGARRCIPLRAVQVQRIDRDGVALGSLAVEAATGSTVWCPAELYEARAQRAELRREILALPKAQAETLLSVMLGANVASAGRARGVSKPTALKAYKRGVERLRERMVGA